jgi:hypothetical protein
LEFWDSVTVAPLIDCFEMLPPLSLRLDIIGKRVIDIIKSGRTDLINDFIFNRPIKMTINIEGKKEKKKAALLKRIKLSNKAHKSKDIINNLFNLIFSMSLSKK